MVRCDEIVTLSWVLQWYTGLMGTPLGILCSTVQDFCRCLAPLIKSDDLLIASMLEVAEEEEPPNSLSPAEEARSLGEKPEPQEEQPTAIHAPNHPEEASEPEGASSLGVMAIVQRQLPLTPPGFMEPLAVESEPPHLKYAVHTSAPFLPRRGSQIWFSSGSCGGVMIIP